MKYKNFISFDLEMNQPSRKIIQIGACIGNIHTANVSKKIRIYVNPQEEITEFITNLTGITNKIIKQEGISIQDAYKTLCEIIKIEKPFMNPITWGRSDSIELRDELGITSDEFFIFGRRWIDVKTLFIS